jgi:hypothetical protein
VDLPPPTQEFILQHRNPEQDPENESDQAVESEDTLSFDSPNHDNSPPHFDQPAQNDEEMNVVAIDDDSEPSAHSIDEERREDDESSDVEDEDLCHLFDGPQQCLEVDSIRVPLFDGSTATLFDLVMKVLTFSITTKSSQSQVELMLQTISELSPKPNIVPSYFEFRKIIATHSLSVSFSLFIVPIHFFFVVVDVQSCSFLVY